MKIINNKFSHLKHFPKYYGDSFHNNLHYMKIEYLEYSIEDYMKKPKN